MQPQDGNIVFQLRMLDNLLRKNGEAHMRQLDSEHQLTRMHYWIIGHLYRHDGEELFQRDIETTFRISRSTTSSILSLMEKKGLIMRSSVESDARLKKLTLTDKARSIHEKQMDEFRKMDDDIEKAITPEEKAELIRIIEKLRAAVKASLPEDAAQTE